jgi:hypothetical protein
VKADNWSDASAEIAVSLPSSGVPVHRSPLCVMCDHERAVHTVATDGAGWCGEGRRCECGGFQLFNRLLSS